VRSAAEKLVPHGLARKTLPKMRSEAEYLGQRCAYEAFLSSSVRAVREMFSYAMLLTVFLMRIV
ncbi:hypothetical protein, partial [Lewinella cohaerens]|uniref:hypothetical protein n=1 Tax=Lewinella cohaerens TaxID=70995 RepID=UPI0005C6A757